jgi:hypothetical protein
VDIKWKAPSHSHRNLGFHLQGNGKTDSHKKVMRKKAEAYGEAIRGSILKRGESSTAYNCYYMPSIAYSTPATTLTFKECDDLQKPVVNAILPKMGITSKAPRAVVFGTPRYGGIGLDHLALVQSHGQLQYLLGHLRCRDTTGKLIRMIMEFTQMECGCTGNVFEQSYKQYAGVIIDENWVTSIWAHLERCEATVKITGLWKPKYGRENDNATMETITASGRFRPVEIREINRCRLYLQVFYTSDIADNRGKTLEPWVTKGQRQIARKIIWEWSVQQRPTTWKAWKKAITELFTQDGSMLQPLGAWYVEHHTNQEWYLDTRAQELWHQKNDKCTRHHAQNIGRLRFVTQDREVAEPPIHALTHVATVTQRHRYIDISKHTHICTPTHHISRNWFHTYLS